MDKPPETDPVAPVHPKVHGAPEPRQLPPRSVTGKWEVETFDDDYPVRIHRVLVRHTELVQVDVVWDEMPMYAHIRSCPCCGRPWTVALYLRNGSPNLATIWGRNKRLDVGSAAYGIAVRAGLRGTDNPEQQHHLLGQLLPPKP